MGIFDLVLIASVLLSLVTLLLAAGLAVTGRFRVAGRVVRAWGLAVAVYLAIVMIVSLFTRPRALAIGEDACFDDWCIAVERIDRGPQRCAVGFRVSSRARRISQRERHLVVYLRDDHGQRHEAEPVAAGEAFDVLLGPGQSIHTTRTFDVPADAAVRGQLVITHEGGFPIAWFIIGEGPFHKPIEVAVR
jgi:hypothetical protein